MFVIQWILEYKEALSIIITLGIIVVAVIPIYQHRKHNKNFTKQLRAQIRRDLVELIQSCVDKLKHIQLNPGLTQSRLFKITDKQNFAHLEKLFENVNHLSDKEFKLFDELLVFYIAYSWAFLKKGLNKTGLEKLEEIARKLLKLLNEHLGFYTDV